MKKTKKVICILVLTMLVGGFFPFGVVKKTAGNEILSSLLKVSAEESRADTSKLSDEELMDIAMENYQNMSSKDKEIQNELLVAFSTYTSEELDIQNMTSRQEEVFEKYIANEAEKLNLPTSEDEKSYENTLLEVFDSESEVYQNVEKATETLVEELDENHSSPFDNLTGEKVLAASHGWISVALLGSIINTTINLFLIGCGVGSIWTLIKKKGITWVKNTFKSRVKSRLVATLGSGVAVYYSYVWDFVMTVVDPGTSFARWLDARDKKPRNGWIELW